MTLSAGTIVAGITPAPSVPASGLYVRSAAIARLRLCLFDTEQARLGKRLALSALYANLDLAQRDHANLPDDGATLREAADLLGWVGGPASAALELRNEADRQDRRRNSLEGDIQDIVQKADDLDREIHALDALHADYELALEKLGA